MKTGGRVERQNFFANEIKPTDSLSHLVPSIYISKQFLRSSSAKQPYNISPISTSCPTNEPHRSPSWTNQQETTNNSSNNTSITATNTTATQQRKRPRQLKSFQRKLGHSSRRTLKNRILYRKTDTSTHRIQNIIQS